MKTYKELEKYITFKDRYVYLKIGQAPCEETFGYYRKLNQILYKSAEWRRARRDAILRDDGNDLGCVGYPIMGDIYVHHINPITIEDIKNRDPKIFDLDNLICCSYTTHQAIHYGTYDDTSCVIPERKPNDQAPWR